jgi:hypothetical protein
MKSRVILFAVCLLQVALLSGTIYIESTGTHAVSASLSGPAQDIPMPECWPCLPPVTAAAVRSGNSNPSQDIPMPECWPCLPPVAAPVAFVRASGPSRDIPMPECWPCLPPANGTV